MFVPHAPLHLHAPCLRQAGRENEELLSAGVEARDRLQALEQAASAAGDLPRLQRRLHADMAACHAELRALVELCTQCAQGRDLNVSALLGVRGQCRVCPARQGQRSVSAPLTGVSVCPAQGQKSVSALLMVRGQCPPCSGSDVSVRPAWGQRSVSALFGVRGPCVRAQETRISRQLLSMIF